MDAMDVLGALLGKKAGSGSAGGNILKDMLGGGRRPSPPAQTRRAPQPQSRSRPKTIGDAAKSLEDLLNVSNNHHSQRRQAPAPQRQAPPPQRTPEQESLNEQSMVLIRAMVNAAKSDGQITQDEQDAILKRMDHVSQEEIDFLRKEFAAKTDVRDFAWSVPLGMEEQAYAMSVIAIDLDEQKEAQYLGDLAHGLRLAPSRCNEIHRKYGAPEIFQEN
ncbi:DUF533 domain-containing protein [Planctomycetes bacterium K23_9]|uniref:Inner membrane protein YebE n=1 Tax=Stieleria marina TaxID=1930275 RepID=A0A517NX99_9BACT|nr:hypothetical protein K239x_37530 [Planctomycetes bacterium K23_9]